MARVEEIECRKCKVMIPLKPLDHLMFGGPIKWLEHNDCTPPVKRRRRVIRPTRNIID